MGLRRDSNDIHDAYSDFEYEEDGEDLAHKREIRRMLEEKLERKRLKLELRDELDPEFNDDFDEELEDVFDWKDNRP